jgi:transcriptional regulator
MYIPNANREDDQAKLVAFMRAHSFIALVSIVDGAPWASHIPVVVEETDEGVIITGHLARANPHWQSFGQGETLAIFTGPHAYISPTLYEKHENVPTWNYIAVHAYGVPTIATFAEHPERLDAIVAALIAENEASYAQQWAELTPKYREGMLRGIVGFEMPVTRLEGKYKLSQNRSATDQEQVATALRHNDEPTIAAVGIAMLETMRK